MADAVRPFVQHRCGLAQAHPLETVILVARILDPWMIGGAKRRPKPARRHRQERPFQQHVGGFVGTHAGKPMMPLPRASRMRTVSA